MGTSYFLDEMI